MRGLSRIAGLVAAMALLQACSNDSTAPETLAGTYSLAQADGESLPAEVFNAVVEDPVESFHLRVVANSGKLTLRGDGKYEFRANHTAYIDEMGAYPQRWSDHGSYSVAGDSVHFESNYIENVRFSAARGDGALRIMRDFAGEGQAAEYTFTR